MNKILVLALLSLSFSVFANDHVAYHGATEELEDNDPCIGVAVNSIIEKMQSEYDKKPDLDASDLDMVGIWSVKNKGSKYTITASENDGPEKEARKFEITVQCSGTIKEIKKK